MTYTQELKSASDSIENAQTEFNPDENYGPNQTAAIRSSLELAAAIIDLRMED